MRWCLCLQQRLRGEVTAELVVEAEAVIGEPAHLAVHDHQRRGVVFVLDEEFVGQPLDVHDERVAVAAHEEADGLALLLLACCGRRPPARTCRRRCSVSSMARQHRAEERAVQLRDQHADAVRAARRQRLRDGIRLVAELAASPPALSAASSR